MKRFLTLLVVCLCLSLGIAGCNGTSSSGSGDIALGGKSFTEQEILVELLAQQIEATTDLKVLRRPQLGGTFICHTAMLAGEIDGYIEYTGTSYTTILEQKEIPSPEKVYNFVKENYEKKFNVQVAEPLGFENTYAIIIRGKDAKKYNVETLSEATKYTPEWRMGFGYEFGERPDGFPGLAKTYNLQFKKKPMTMDLNLVYRALTQGLVDMVAGNSTDGQIASLGLKVLGDDKKYFPPYEAVPVIRKDTLEKYPQLKKPLSQLAGILTADEMQQLNYQVGGELREVKDVISEFRKSKGI